MLDIWQQFAAWILPRICVCCGFNSNNMEIDLCNYCREFLPWITERCYQCGLRLNKPLEAIKCNKCRDFTPPYNRLCALFAYEPPLTSLINQLKFSQKLYHGAVFGYLLAETAQKYWYTPKAMPEAIIPMPLHITRQRIRGYNQALEIATRTAKLLKIPLVLDICSRSKPTQQQTRLDKAQRQLNVQGVFMAKVGHHYKHVAIIDDVVTTGSTVKALSLALMHSGVEVVDVWCVCRV